MTPHGPWKIVSSRTVYEDPWINVRIDDVIRPDQKPGIHSVIALIKGVTVLAMDDDRQVYLTEEFHYAVGRLTLECVSGGSDPGEDPLTTARRELREEIGVQAGRFHDLGSLDPFTTNILAPTRVYLAQQLEFCESMPEGTEQIRCVKMPFEEAFAKVMSGEITHSPSCVAILKSKILLDAGKA